MDVKDYSQKLDQARDGYRQAQNDLRASYNKSIDDNKNTFDNKIEKLSKNYDKQKSELEEQNSINNQLYSDKTKQTIADRSERFRNDIKKNSDKFDEERQGLKTNFNDRLSDLSDSYKKSTEEKNRYHEQALKSMADKYSKANDSYKANFEGQVEHLEEKNKNDFQNIKDQNHKTQMAHDQSSQDELEKLRSSGQEERFKEISRLKNDNDSLRTNFERERASMAEEKEARIADVLKSKKIESEEGQKNFSNLQDEIRHKNLATEEKMQHDHRAESKALEKKFSDELRTMQHMTNQKIKGGNVVSTLKDENKQLVNNYEKRLQSAREEAEKNTAINIEKEQRIDDGYREKLKSLKLANVEDLDRKETELTTQNNKSLQEFRDKNDTVVDRYKTEISRNRADTEDKLSKADTRSKGQIKEQRVEFGKFINNVNAKKMEEISSLKEELTKDKTSFIEKTRKDVSDEKYQMKESFNHQMNVKEDLYERKLSEMEKQTNKIIENYENRLEHLIRKSEKEVDSIKNTEQERREKENQSIRLAFENQDREHQSEMDGLRTKYENMIGKDRALKELQTNQLVQKYEDQLERERVDHQKELSLKLGESQSQFERLFKASQLEKETLRNQYEQRMENMKNATLVQGNSKKS